MTVMGAAVGTFGCFIDSGNTTSKTVNERPLKGIEARSNCQRQSACGMRIGAVDQYKRHRLCRISQSIIDL